MIHQLSTGIPPSPSKRKGSHTQTEREGKMSPQEVALQLTLELVKQLPRLDPKDAQIDEHLRNQAALLGECYGIVLKSVMQAQGR